MNLCANLECEFLCCSATAEKRVMPLIQECSEDEKGSSECAQGASGTSDVVTQPELGPLAHDYEPSDEEIIPVRAIQQESFKGVQKSRQVVPLRMPSYWTLSLQPSGLQYFWQRVSCTSKVLVEKYTRSRNLLGNRVEDAHAAWHEFVACDSFHPVIKASTLSFGVISTPENVAYLQQHWDDLRQRMNDSSPDYKVACFMVQYALAWAMQSKDLGKALTKVEDCYKEMQELNPDNFFLAPSYTVTIGRWIYEMNTHNLSWDVIAQVLGYVDETLRLIETLEDDWARIDAFGAKLSALRLLMLVEEYCYTYSLGFTEFRRNLRSRIEDLYANIHKELSENSSRIVLYDKAWFHSVSATYYQTASNTATTQDEKEHLSSLAQRSIAQSARLYDKNGRWWRAREEAERTGDPNIIHEYSGRQHDAPSV